MHVAFQLSNTMPILGNDHFSSVLQVVLENKTKKVFCHVCGFVTYFNDWGVILKWIWSFPTGHLGWLAEPSERLIPDLWIHFKTDDMQLKAIFSQDWSRRRRIKVLCNVLFLCSDYAAWCSNTKLGQQQHLRCKRSQGVTERYQFGSLPCSSRVDMKSMFLSFHD